MKFLKFLVAALFIFSIDAVAYNSLSLKFNRAGTDASSVSISAVDERGNAIEDVSVSMTSTHGFKPSMNSITNSIICPDANANTNPTIELQFAISGIAAGFSFDRIGLDIHALNGASNYQMNSDNVTRQWNVDIEQGVSTLTSFGSLSDIDIAAGIGSTNAVHQVWGVTNSAVECNGTLNIKLKISKGTTNEGCFFGLSEIILNTSGDEPEPEPEPEPTLPGIDESAGKIYNITWKNTGGSYITEDDNNKMYVDSYDVTKRQFWQFIPTGNADCYYIRNTASGRYIGSCNLTPSSASKIYTTTTPVEYYIAKTSKTSGENANCWYMSSTDCSNYNNESMGPRALNKDGASSDVITWTAGVNNVGSYWQFVETENLYEVRPFDASSAIGNIASRYNIEGVNGTLLTLNETGVELAANDLFNNSQEWYFVGTSNANGWKIASVAKPATVIGISAGNIVAGEAVTTTWKVKESSEKSGYFYFTSNDDSEQTLTVNGESLFRFNRLRSAYARKTQIYNNPCGTAGNNYAKSITVSGKEVLSTLTYTATSKPSKWHILYPHDKAVVTKNNSFDIDITLSQNASNALVVCAYFDWNSDGVFETEQQLTTDAATCHATVNVPEWAVEKQSRMRIRVNSSGLDYAEDDVEGFVYDFIIITQQPQASRTVALSVNSPERGTATLSETSDSYEYGATLTATATPIGNSTFVCWRSGSIVVSTDAEYTFTVDHNIELTAYFSPNTDEESLTGIAETPTDANICIEQQGNKIVATSSADIISMRLYTIDAAVVAKSSNNFIETGSLSEGVYIVRVSTVEGSKNIKLYIQK